MTLSFFLIGGRVRFACMQPQGAMYLYPLAGVCISLKTLVIDSFVGLEFRE